MLNKNSGDNKAHQIEVKDLTMVYGETIIQENLNFKVDKGSIFIIMGDSGGGKSTLLRHMVGLIRPYRGDVLYNGKSFWHSSRKERRKMLHLFGVSYQGGALWSSMTLSENIGLPLKQFTELKPFEIDEIVSLKLSLVGLAGFENYYPAEISGGMRKRAGLARAMALDPEILFFDEPTSDLDPLSAKHLDNLIREICDSMNTTFIIVTHDLGTIFGIADNAIFLDVNEKTITARGNPKEILDQTKNDKLIHFLTRTT